MAEYREWGQSLWVQLPPSSGPASDQLHALEMAVTARARTDGYTGELTFEWELLREIPGFNSAMGLPIPAPGTTWQIVLMTGRRPARHKPRPLVCRYCGSTLVVYWDGVPLNAVWIECADLGDDEGNNACKASWQTDGKPLTDQKGTPIDD